MNFFEREQQWMCVWGIIRFASSNISGQISLKLDAYWSLMGNSVTKLINFFKFSSSNSVGLAFYMLLMCVCV